MAAIQEDNSNAAVRHRKPRQKRSSTFIDMTPMVDLAFLLLTFFIMTTTFKSNKFIDLQMPSNVPTTQPTTIGESQAFNLILMKGDKLKWYMGSDDKSATANEATFSGNGVNNIRKILLNKNALVMNSICSLKNSLSLETDSLKRKDIEAKILSLKKNPKALVVMIKPTDKASYNGLIKILDLMMICDIDRYALMDLSDTEKKVFEL